MITALVTILAILAILAILVIGLRGLLAVSLLVAMGYDLILGRYK